MADLFSPLFYGNGQARGPITGNADPGGGTIIPEARWKSQEVDISGLLIF